MVRLVGRMSTEDCADSDLESITIVDNMEDSRKKANQNGVLTIAKNGALESIVLRVHGS